MPFRWFSPLLEWNKMAPLRGISGLVRSIAPACASRAAIVYRHHVGTSRNSHAESSLEVENVVGQLALITLLRTITFITGYGGIDSHQLGLPPAASAVFKPPRFPLRANTRKRAGKTPRKGVRAYHGLCKERKLGLLKYFILS